MNWNFSCSIGHHLFMDKTITGRKRSENLKQMYVPHQSRRNFKVFSLSRFKQSSNVFRTYMLDFFLYPMHYYPFHASFYFTRGNGTTSRFLSCYWSMRTVFSWCSWGRSCFYVETLFEMASSSGLWGCSSYWV